MRQTSGEPIALRIKSAIINTHLDYPGYFVLGIFARKCRYSGCNLYPNVAKMCRKKTRQGAPDVASHSLGEVEAYFAVREILPETSKGADGVTWFEFSGFGRQQVCNVRV